VVHARLCRDVGELPVAVVLEQDVSHLDRGDIEVRVAVVVDVGEGTCDAHAIRQCDSSRLGDVLEPPIAQVSPQLVPAELGREVDVEPAVAIHVRDGDPVSMVVVNGLVVVAPVVHDLVPEPDPALGETVLETKGMEDSGAGESLSLKALSSFQSGYAGVLVRRRDLQDRMLLRQHGDAHQQRRERRHCTGTPGSPARPRGQRRSRYSQSRSRFLHGDPPVQSPVRRTTWIASRSPGLLPEGPVWVCSFHATKSRFNARTRINEQNSTVGLQAFRQARRQQLHRRRSGSVATPQRPAY